MWADGCFRRLFVALEKRLRRTGQLSAEEVEALAGSVAVGARAGRHR